jgi:hypothetical protein
MKKARRWFGVRAIVLTPELKRQKAKNEGRPTYWTGETCERGHSSSRSTETGLCIWCVEGPPKHKPNVNIEVSNKLEEIRLARELEDYQ